MLKSKFTFKRVLLFIVMLAGFLVLVGCAAKADSIALSDSSLTLTVGDKKTVTATVLPEDVESEVTWESDKPEFATVSTTGEIAAIAAGTATITATIDEKSATVTVTVVLEKFNVTFESNGGSAVTALKVDKGAKATKPTNPTQAGLEFVGWFTDSILTQAYDFNTAVSADVKLYAKWEPVKVSFTFNSNGGSAVPAGQVNHGSKLSSVQYTYFIVPNKEGYSFQGWYLDEECTEEVDFTANIIEAFTVYAKWEAREYTITFDGNFTGSKATTAKVNFTEKLTKPAADPVRAGWVFAGWYKEAAATTAYDFNVVIPANDFTLYAKWTPGKTKVSFEKFGGSGLDFVEVTTTEAVTAPTAPTKIGYVFEGWYTEAALLNKYDFTTAVDVPITLYAKWNIPTADAVTMEFDLGGGYWPISTTTPFLSTSAQDTHAVQSFNGGYWSYYTKHILIYKGTTSEAYQLYAHVIALKATESGMYQVEKLYKAGTAVNKAEAETMDYLLVAHDAYAAGYKFLGSLVVGNVITISGVNMVTVKTGVIDGQINVFPVGTVMVPKPIMVKDSTLPIPAKAEHRFAGWYADAEFTGVPVTTAAATGKLFAKWVKAPVFTFNTYGGTEIAKQVLIENKAVKPAEPTKTNLYFAGWYSDARFTTPFDFETVINEDTTIYSKWTNGIEIVYMDGDKALHDPFTNMVKINTKLAKPADPTKKAFLFDGWYLDAAFATEYDFETAAPLTADLTLYSKWTAAVDVTLYDGETKIGDAYLTRTGQPLKEPVDPVKAGFKVAGWFTDKELTVAYDFDANVTEAVTLYVKWEDAVKVTLLDGEDEIEDPILIKKGTAFTKPTADPEKTGYDFVGWFSDKELKKAFDFTKTFDANVVVYAKFVKYTVTYNTDGGVLTYETKNAMLVDFLTDYYAFVEPTETLATFIHGYGKTSGFGGTWYTAHRNQLFDGTKPAVADDTKAFFIYQPAYFAKWMALFDTIEELVVEANELESIFGATADFGLVKINEYITNASITKMPEKFAVVKSFLKATPAFQLALVEKAGFTFGGWFTKADLSGTAITEVAAEAEADVTVYAKWTAIPAED